VNFGTRIILDLIGIKALGFTVDEYLTLIKAYYREGGIDVDYTGRPQVLKTLEERMFIKNTADGPVLREKGWAVFEDRSTDKFDTFFNLFPKKVPTDKGDMRQTIPPGEDHKQSLRRLWIIITNNDDELQSEIIKKLELDISSKEARGELMYLPNMSKWLAGRYWERVETAEYHHKTIN